MAIINCIRRRPNQDGEYEYNEGVDDSDFPVEDWVHNPDVSALAGTDPEFWVWNGQAVVLRSSYDQNTDRSRKKKFVLEASGRLYCYTDDRWITPGDDNYGYYYYQWAESAGTNVEPLMEWEHQGHLVKAGDILTGITLSCKSTNTSVTELEAYLVLRYPTLGNAGFFSGVDSDTEMEFDEVFREKMVTPENTEMSGEIWTGNSNDTRRRDIPIDYVCEHDGWLTWYFGPTNTSTSTRYFPMTYRLDLLGD